MSHERHRYRVHEGDTYSVVQAYPPGEAPDGEPREGEEVTVAEALKRARGPGGLVWVHPCPCGECSLSTYARDHPSSVLAMRVRRYRAHGGPDPDADS